MKLGIQLFITQLCITTAVHACALCPTRLFQKLSTRSIAHAYRMPRCADPTPIALPECCHHDSEGDYNPETSYLTHYTANKLTDLKKTLQKRIMELCKSSELHKQTNHHIKRINQQRAHVDLELSHRYFKPSVSSPFNEDLAEIWHMFMERQHDINAELKQRLESFLPTTSVKQTFYKA